MIYSFSTSALKLVEQPTPDRPQIGASSLFDNVQVETEEKLAKQEKKVIEKEVSLSLFSISLNLLIQWILIQMFIRNFVVSILFSQLQDQSS